MKDSNIFRDARLLAGMTALEVARLSGIHRSTISIFENGQAELSPLQRETLRGVLIGAIQLRLKKLLDGLKMLEPKKEVATGVGAHSDDSKGRFGDVDSSNHAP